MATNNSSSLPVGSAIRLPGMTIEGGNSLPRMTIEGGNDKYAGIEDLYGFGALYDNDFIDTELGIDPFAIPMGNSTIEDYSAVPPSTISPFDFEDSKDTFDISKFEAPETEEEKQGLFKNIREALSKMPANILNGLILQSGVKNLGLLPGFILSKLTAGALNDTVTPFVQDVFKAVGDTGKDALGNIFNFRNSLNQSTTDQSTPNQTQEGSNNLQGSGDPFEITDFGSYVVNESGTSSFDESSNFVNQAGANNSVTDGSSEVSSNDTSESNQTNNEMDNESNTNPSGSGQGSSGMGGRLEEYYNILREQGSEAASIYAENLGLFVEGVGSALFGAARQYTDEQLMSLGRSVGINDGSVPTIQEITQAGIVLDPSEERRVMDSLMGSQVAGGRQFDPAVAQSAIDMNQMMYNRRQPFITAGINASNIAPGIQFGGGIASTMEGALPSFADKMKFDTAQQQNQFNQDLLEAQREAGDSNRFVQGFNALTQAYGQDLFGFKSNIVDPLLVDPATNLIQGTLKNLGINTARSNNNFSNVGSNSNSRFDKDLFELIRDL